jgi:hypothetical protein
MTSSAAATAPTGERRTIVNFGGNIRWAPLVYQPANDQEVPTTRRSCRSCANTPGRDGFEGIGTPARSPGAPATREEAHGTPSARPRPASKLGIHIDARALPDGRAKIRILRAVDRARACVPLRTLLRFLRLSPSRFQAWRRLQHACALDDRSSRPHTSPHRLSPPEVRAIKDMVTALELVQAINRVGGSPQFAHRRPSYRKPPEGFA